MKHDLAKDILVVLVLAAAGVGLPALLAIGSGAFNLPHNDDFNFRRIAFGLFDTGTVELTGYSVMSLVGQLVFVQPFLWASGGDAWAYGASTAVLAMAGIAAAYHLVRTILSRPFAAFSVLSLLYFPGFLVNTTSFMTDVPALTGEIVCLALGAIALERRGAERWRWLVGSLVAGCFAFSIREFALAAPIAVLACVGVSAPGQRVRVLLAGLATLIACGTIHVITAHLPGQGSAQIDLSSVSIVRIQFAAATLGLVLSPALLLAMARWWRCWRAVDIVIGAFLGIFFLNDEIGRFISTGQVPGVLIGNLLEPVGAPGGVAMGYRPILLGSPIWEALNAIGLIAVVVGSGVLGASIGRWLRTGHWIRSGRLADWLGSIEGLLAVFSLLYGAGFALFALVAPVYDRYLWPLSIPLTCLLLRPVAGGMQTEARAASRRIAVATAGLLTTTLAATSGAILLNSFAFDVAGWRMGELAVSRGFAPGTVDAGMAWVGFQATGTANPGAQPSPVENWYDAWWPSFHLCAMVTSSLVDVPEYRLEYADIEAYRLLLFDGPQEPLYLYSVSGPGCP